MVLQSLIRQSFIRSWREFDNDLAQGSLFFFLKKKSAEPKTSSWHLLAFSREVKSGIEPGA